MSEPQQPTVLDPDVAYGRISQQIYTPVFFNKVAEDYGVVPESPQEAMEMLSTAAQLRAAYDQERQKTAADQHSMLLAARQHLGGNLDVEGAAGVTDGEIDKVAAHIATNPEIVHAALSLQIAAAAAANG
jgi:hypothetical protein